MFLRSGPAGATFPRGDLAGMADGQQVVLCVRKIAINKAVAPASRQNLLPGILRRWFGDDAGAPGNGFKVWMRRRGESLGL